MSGKGGRKAVVLGGSIAGLLAARALSEGYDEVLVVDRDTYPDEAVPRRGVPQGRHIHGLLARGKEALEELFPGFVDELRDHGALTCDLGHGVRWYFHGRRLRRAETGLAAIAATRPLLEHVVRGRVAALPNVVLRDRTEFTTLLTDPDRTRVTGVRLLHDGATEEVTADLVVDATGRGSRLPVLLAELGYPKPVEEHMKIDLRYATRFYRQGDKDLFDGDQSINTVSTPVTPRGAFFSKMENGKIILSLTGVVGDRVPTDPEAFTAYARSLPVPDVHDIISEGEPIDDPVPFRHPTSVWRHYEDLDRFPEGLLVVGDAVCSPTPVYAQGMTIAAVEAITLRDHAHEGADPRAAAFFTDIAKTVRAAWESSTTGDLGFAGVPGDRPLKIRVGNAYVRRLHAAAGKDGSLTAAFMRVAGMVDPPEALMRPAVMLRVLRHGRRSAAPSDARR
ncbi:FAD-dependent monooxygenase [Actinomadura flavalba]|uniref:FAD-dependent monooxygenase n=1 Tax=Actinomadura flavalba TaxID=1120938 RepID=UPI000367AD67|nr:FAD-dependent monooxygenase [Actinomadura flavalba]